MSRRAQSGDPDPDGILLVDKPSGMTSHDMVDGVRRSFRFNKVGHGGTLDPMATGLLILLIGRATRLFDRIMGGDKTYEGVFRLGTETDTEDRDGRVLTQLGCPDIAEERIIQCMTVRKGDQMQTPPMVSAIKRNGVPLYKLARTGQTVEREPRFIHVFDFQLLSYCLPDIQFRLTCTKGTYVRTLCADIGRELGCGAYLEALSRTASGSYRVNDAVTLETIRGLTRTDLVSRMIPVNKITGIG